jgi:predicted metal-dependent phosphoesterase TrpH
LHVHSSVSDGLCAPDQLVQMASEAGLSAISLTDHDTVAGVDPGLLAASGTTLQVITGVEISTLVGSVEAHVLGYFIDHRSPQLLETLAVLRASRLRRAESILSVLVGLGIRLSWDQIQGTREDGGIIGRPHIAQALVEQGHASSIEQAFDRYLNRGSPAYVERYKLSPVEAIDVIRTAGGIAVLAHPLDIIGLVPELAKNGLAGLEVFYRGYSPGEVSGLLSVARQNELIPTGGTDFHGRSEPNSVPLGGIFIPPRTVELLKARANAPLN